MPSPICSTSLPPTSSISIVSPSIPSLSSLISLRVSSLRLAICLIAVSLAKFCFLTHISLRVDSSSDVMLAIASSSLTSAIPIEASSAFRVSSKSNPAIMS